MQSCSSTPYLQRTSRCEDLSKVHSSFYSSVSSRFDRTVIHSWPVYFKTTYFLISQQVVTAVFCQKLYSFNLSSCDVSVTSRAGPCNWLASACCIFLLFRDLREQPNIMFVPSDNNTPFFPWQRALNSMPMESCLSQVSIAMAFILHGPIFIFRGQSQGRATVVDFSTWKDQYISLLPVAVEISLEVPWCRYAPPLGRWYSRHTSIEVSSLDMFNRTVHHADDRLWLFCF